MLNYQRVSRGSLPVEGHPVLGCTRQLAGADLFGDGRCGSVAVSVDVIILGPLVRWVIPLYKSPDWCPVNQATNAWVLSLDLAAPHLKKIHHLEVQYQWQ